MTATMDLRPVIAALAEAMGHAPPPAQECWCCGTQWRLIHSGPAKGLCDPCGARWRYQGFTGNGPSYRRLPVADRIEDHAHTITTRSAAQAAAEIGVCVRTIQRWRRALRQAT